jgi:DNA-binding response OmpR family regulator
MQLKDYGIEVLDIEAAYHKSKNKTYKVKDKEISEPEFHILSFLFEHKNKFVTREYVIEIRKQYYRNHNKIRNVAPEISRIIHILNKAFKTTEIPFEILSANGKVGLFTNEGN